ncbi:MAG: LysE/ArgO family amino acid transporter [Rothia sp. (in: high G+C Gram-positive bacteria)]|nr:LysE/ArgO family amino acid transporter [Rothia sp. (in: high G+C Gram-positive bacteria)]
MIVFLLGLLTMTFNILWLILVGMGTGLSLIVAIGAQNAFILKQGIIGRFITPIVLVCILSDALLIGIGIFSVGKLAQSAAWVLEVLRWAGAAFLLCYGLLALRRAFRPGTLEVDTQQEGPQSLGRALAITLAITYLNPHVYVDTMALLGTLANTYGQSGRWWFYLGTVLGSTVWFLALGYGSRLLRPLFAQEKSWRILDAVIAAIMLFLAYEIALG